MVGHLIFVFCCSHLKILLNRQAVSLLKAAHDALHADGLEPMRRALLHDEWERCLLAAWAAIEGVRRVAVPARDVVQLGVVSSLILSVGSYFSGSDERNHLLHWIHGQKLGLW